MIKTSIQYQLSNVVLPMDALEMQEQFNKMLSMGPEAVKRYLDNRWHFIAGKTDICEFNDADKEITPASFNASRFIIQKNMTFYLFEFPDYEYRDAACKYGLVVISDFCQKYFTLEYSEHVISKEPCFVVGEWYKDEEGEMRHKNYGTVELPDKYNFMFNIVYKILYEQYPDKVTDNLLKSIQDYNPSLFIQEIHV